jgi:hypothetical protein
MEMSPSLEAASCAAIQEFSNILRNQKVHYCVHSSPPLVPILSCISRFPTTSTYLYKINFIIIILPPTSMSS